MHHFSNAVDMFIIQLFACSCLFTVTSTMVPMFLLQVKCVCYGIMGDLVKSTPVAANISTCVFSTRGLYIHSQSFIFHSFPIAPDSFCFISALVNFCFFGEPLNWVLVFLHHRWPISWLFSFCCLTNRYLNSRTILVSHTLHIFTVCGAVPFVVESFLICLHNSDYLQHGI